MTALRRAVVTPAWLRASWLVLALCTAAIARAALNGHTTLTAFVAGAAFGAVLLVAATEAGWKIRRPGLGAVLLGVAGGLVLVILRHRKTCE